PSNYLKGLIIRNIKAWPENKLVKVPNGIHPSKFSPGKKKKIILSTGRLLPRKGFQYLIKAVSDIESDYEVHICGDGPMMSELRELATQVHMMVNLQNQQTHLNPHYGQ
ncbi:glycosyltransferase, partial [archaeon]|nr:glycosyltransferase [archaeon]